MIQLDHIRDGIPNVHREGWPFIADCSSSLALVFASFVPPLFWLLIILAGWMAIFFRDPVRVVPTAPGLSSARRTGGWSRSCARSPPPELGLGEDRLARVSVFMNVFDCHINRAPVAGPRRAHRLQAGKIPERRSRQGERGERAERRRHRVGERADVGVVQIAGLVARRIVCWTREGASVSAGERIGMIRFGSRLDVYLPEGSTVAVSAGQSAIAGETVIAVLPGASLAPPFPTRRD